MTIAFLDALDQYAASPFPVGWPADHLTFNSPTDQVEEAIVATINATRVRQALAMYSFTHPALIAAFVAKIRAGLPTLCVLDSSEWASETEQRALAPLIACIGMPNLRLAVGTAPDGTDISHWKVYVGDDTAVVTGSFNWTESACKENNQCTIGLWPFDASLLTSQIEAAYAWMIAHCPQPNGGS